jgi:branched-chain amino acid transport system substrate-binding protein
MITRRQIAAIGTALALALSACGDDNGDDGGGGDDPGDVSEEEAADLLGPENVAEGEPVRIGLVGDGATDAFDNRDELRAGEAAAEYWNTHRGGLAGRPVEVRTCEMGNEPARATDCADQLIEDDVVAVALSQSGVADSVWEPLHEAGIPTMFLQTSAQEYLMDGVSSFTMMNPLGTLLGLPMAVAEEEGVDHIAFVIIDVPQAREGIEGTAPLVLEPAGIDYDVIAIAPGTADMSAQMQQVVNSGAGLVHVTGNDAFCISAFNGLATAGYAGPVAAVSQCITDVTQDSVPGDVLEGTYITASQALGADHPTYRHYRAVIDTYGDDVEDVENVLGMGGYAAVLSLLLATEELEGDVTPETVIEAAGSMPEQEVPGGGGATFQCGGSATDLLPAVCSNQSLQAVLDGDGRLTDYQVLDATELMPDL